MKPISQLRDAHTVSGIVGLPAGRPCWIDLAASDAAAAASFYGGLFGWTARDEKVNGGIFTRLSHQGCDVGSLYQLSHAHRGQGVPSHWTAYIQVDDVDAAARRADALGAEVLVRPFAVDGIARIAVILDPVGAQIGLWQPINAGTKENGHG
jgi:predicted enzyme related to lactoylglutathione lyase